MQNLSNWDMDHRVEVKVERKDLVKIRQKEVMEVLCHGDVEGMQNRK